MYSINFESLNILLNKAYQLGRDNENRMERGVPELDVEHEFSEFLHELNEDMYMKNSA